MKNKLTIEVWSDFVCPFCYIGKRKFEKALASFPNKDFLQIEWKSFQLDPHAKYKEGKDAYDYLAELKGQTREWSVKVHESVVEMAKNVGLDYRFDKAKTTNTFDAHRLLQYAKKYRLSHEMEERLFKAYFTEGELISDYDTLIKLAVEVGLDKEEVSGVLSQGLFAEEVREDISEARKIGAGGVPFFVFQRKYAVSGAQDPNVFLETLEKTYKEFNA